MSQSSERFAAQGAAVHGAAGHGAAGHGALGHGALGNAEVRWMRVVSGLPAVVLAVAFSACGDVGDPNYTSPVIDPVNGVDLASRPYCVGTCLPDYGSSRVDCTADDGLEFFPFDVLNAEPAAGGVATITGFYSYNDGTAEFMASGPMPYTASQANFAPPAVRASGLCGPDNQIRDSNVHHLRGGLFREWGGGMGRRLVDFVTSSGGGTCPAGPSREGDPDYCPDADPRVDAAIAGGASANLSTRFYGMMADLRGWDGISFWARQGPNNTAGIRVYVGDRQLDDDISFIEQNDGGIEPLCRRARECGCSNHEPCTLADGGLTAWFCYDPAEVSSISALRDEYNGRGEGTLFEERYPLCGPTACDDDYDAFTEPDRTFTTAGARPGFTGTAQCEWFDLTNDLGDYFCYDKNDRATFPPDGPERCGDGWAKGVTLESDWTFYKIPFTELRQEGYGKEFQYLDLSKITLVRFTWMQGWIDVWLDDVRFYREASSAPASE
jgi:hypothetical protein